MLKPIDLGNGKWGVKEYDEAGNSLGMKEGEFNSELEAVASFDDSLKAPKSGDENHDKNEAPSAETPDHYLEVSKVEYVPEAEGVEAKTKFMLVNYLLNLDGSKTVKTSEEASLAGQFESAESLLEEVQKQFVEEGWNIKVVFAEETTV